MQSLDSNSSPCRLFEICIPHEIETKWQILTFCHTFSECSVIMHLMEYENDKYIINHVFTFVYSMYTWLLNLLTN